MRETCLTGTLIQPLKTKYYDYTKVDFDISKVQDSMNGITINHVAKIGNKLEICYSVSDPKIIERIMPPKKNIKCSVGALV